VVAGDAATDVKETGSKAEGSKAKPPKLKPARAGPVFSSFESNEVSRAKVYPTVANWSSRYTQRIEIPEDPPAGLRIGNTTLLPTWLETITYEDNLFGASRKKQDDFGVYTQPGLGVRHRFSERIEAGCYYKFGWYDYLDDKARDYLTHDVDFTLNCSNIGIDGLNLNVYDTYAQTANTGALNQSYRAFTRQHQNTSGAMVSYEPGRITAIASYDYTIVDEFGRSGNDYDFHTVKSMCAYKINPRLRPYVKYNFMCYDMIPDQNNYTVHEVSAGAIWR